MPKATGTRISSTRVLEQLRLAARKGDRTALELAVAEMKILALSPRYWEKYLTLLANPLARLVDLLAIKQGDRIAHQKGRKIRATRRPRQPARVAARKPRRRRSAPEQQQLFTDPL